MSLKAAINSKMGGVRIAATLVLALAFLFQAQLIQTHFHPAPATDGWNISKLLNSEDGSGKSNKRLPAEQCPVCEIAAHGQFVSPSAAVALTSLLSVSTIVLAVEARRLVDTISHSWQGRAPPHA